MKKKYTKKDMDDMFESGIKAGKEIQDYIFYRSDENRIIEEDKFALLQIIKRQGRKWVLEELKEL